MFMRNDSVVKKDIISKSGLKYQLIIKKVKWYNDFGVYNQEEDWTRGDLFLKVKLKLYKGDRNKKKTALKMFLCKKSFIKHFSADYISIAEYLVRRYENKAFVEEMLKFEKWDGVIDV